MTRLPARRTLRVMTEKDNPVPHLTAAGAAAAQRRQERLAAALRANLGRRKAQARERRAEPEGRQAKGPGRDGA